MSERDPRAWWERRYRYLPAGVEPPTPFGSRTARRLEALAADLRRPPEVLELGAGTGRDARLFAAAGARVVALDVAATGLERLRGVAGVMPVVADLGAPLPFAGDAFDLVYSHLVLSCDFTDPAVEGVVSEIERVLRPGGELWLCVRSTDDLTYRHGPQPGAGHLPFGETGLHFFSCRSLRRYLARFSQIELDSLTCEIDEEVYGVVCAAARLEVDRTSGSP